MFFSPILIFSVSVTFIQVVFYLIGETYALDQPDLRKRHVSTTPQIGGLVFGLLLISVGWWFGIAPSWYLLGGLVSILLGASDDVRNVSWQVKLMVQVSLVAYLATIFWERFNTITFYTYSFPVTQIFLLTIFLIWFIGIYNAVNLLDGLDGLAGGFMILVCFGAAARRLKLSLLSNFQYLAPTISLFIAIYLYGEAVSFGRWMSFMCVWLAVAMFVRDEYRRASASKVSAPQ